MNMHVRTSSISLSLTLTTTLLALASLTRPASSSTLESFVYVGCSQLKYQPNTPYDVAVNSLLSSLVSSASYAQYNTLKLPVQNDGVLYSLFQCRGDLSQKSCHDCVSAAVDRLGSYCAASSGGAMQLDGCFVRYDNVSFVGSEDKTVVVDKCGPVGSDVAADVGGVLAEMGGGGDFYRVGNVGRVWGVGQCVEDLSVGECQDCLSEAIGRLRSECGSSAWGDMFLGKCYARYSARGSHYSSSSPHSENDQEVEKTLAILIGLIAGVALIIVFLSFLSKYVDSDKGGK